MQSWCRLASSQSLFQYVWKEQSPNTAAFIGELVTRLPGLALLLREENQGSREKAKTLSNLDLAPR